MTNETSLQIVRLAREVDYHERCAAEARRKIAALTREQEINESALEEGKSGYRRGVYLARYINHHIPTGRDFPNEKEFTSRQAFLDEMASWNRRFPDTYAYREV